jgi:hypothetical protein
MADIAIKIALRGAQRNFNFSQGGAGQSRDVKPGFPKASCFCYCSGVKTLNQNICCSKRDKTLEE